MSTIAKLKKASHFLGQPRFDGPPLFVNSMPKAGTNLVESFLIELGYKRNLARCVNETNVGKTGIHPRRGRFYVAHLTDETFIRSLQQTTIFITRPLWSCIKSYVNYMAIDTSHAVSQFVRETPLDSALERLLFSGDNPNERPLVNEYARFLTLPNGTHDLRVTFSDLTEKNPQTLTRIAKSLETTSENVRLAMSSALEKDSYTKNAGRIDLFRSLPISRVDYLKAKVEAFEADAIELRL